MPAENLIQPDAVRRLAWAPPATLTPELVGAALTRAGARRWQVALVAAPLAVALVEPEPEPEPESAPPAQG
jgi:ribonuclease D